MLCSSAIEKSALDIEKSVAQCSPDSVRKVDGNSTNRVVDVELHVKELDHKDNNES